MYGDTRILVSRSALTLFLLLALLISPALAEDRISSEFKITPTVQLNSKEKRALSHAAGQLLNHVNEARADLRYSGGKNASAHVEKGLALANIIQNALPEYDISTTIKSGNLVYKEQEKRKRFLIPMYGELDEIFSVTPALKRAKKEAAGKESLEPPSETELQYTSSFLDVRDAKYYLEQAAAALKKNDPKAADEALSTIQEHVIFQYADVDVPLVAARRDLLEAARLAADNKFDQAKEYLQKAADSLEAYQARVSADMAKKAETLAGEIKTLAKTLDEKKQGAIDAISEFWDKVTNLF